MVYRFPGMDPYLEAPTIWRGFHHALAEEIRKRLNANLSEKYYADVEVHTTFEEVHLGKAKPIVPDVAIVAQPTGTAGVAVAPVAVAEPAEGTAPVRRAVKVTPVTLRAVHIFITETDELITSIELLSPYNKREPGLAEYRRKRSTLLASNVHLVEIDLLRGGQRVGSEVQGEPLEDADYILLVNRGYEINPGVWSDIWPVTLDQPLPQLPIPLDPPDLDVLLDMNAVVRTIYENAAYERRIDYREPVPAPALRPETAKWVEQHLARVA
ncbi:MAG: DUF4058 family protein [Caldilineaceae bacterium]|nr:DUF4058 family protein [Caldilineaceae bacterium]